MNHEFEHDALFRFDSDTGLLKTLETVNNYNVLIKDFPLNGLLAATDIESIRVAIIDIFGHLKKIRNTNYPATRAQALVQAISRDLNEQLFKVLVSQQLMHVRYPFLLGASIFSLNLPLYFSIDEFENTFKEFSEVFKTWEEEEEKFRTVLRDIQKKRADTTVRALRRTAAEHKALQDRLAQLGMSLVAHIYLRTCNSIFSV